MGALLVLGALLALLAPTCQSHFLLVPGSDHLQAYQRCTTVGCYAKRCRSNGTTLPCRRATTGLTAWPAPPSYVELILITLCVEQRRQDGCSQVWNQISYVETA